MTTKVTQIGKYTVPAGTIVGEFCIQKLVREQLSLTQWWLGNITAMCTKLPAWPSSAAVLTSHSMQEYVPACVPAGAV